MAFEISGSNKLSFWASFVTYKEGKEPGFFMNLNDPRRAGNGVTYYDDIPKGHQEILDGWFLALEANPEGFELTIPQYLEKEIVEIYNLFQQEIDNGGFKTHMRDGFDAGSIKFIGMDFQKFRKTVYSHIRATVCGYYDWQIYHMNWMGNQTKTYKGFSANEIHPNAKIIQQGTPISACRVWYHPWFNS